MAERKGFDAPAEPSGNFNFGIEHTSTLDSSEVDSFLNNDPDEVTPVTEKVEPPTQPSTPKVEKKDLSTTPSNKIPSKEDEENEITIDSFLEEEEEEEEQKSEETSENKEEKPDENIPEEEEEENVYQIYADSLFKMGIFSKDEGEEDVQISNPEEFKQRWDLEARKKALSSLDTFIGQFGQKHKDFVVAVLNGVDPEDYFNTYSNIENLSNLDISKEEAQKIVFREYWKQHNVSPEKIEKRLQKAIELGELEEDAKDYYNDLVEQEENNLKQLQVTKKQELAQKEQERKQYQSAIRSIIVNKLKDQEFDGIPINEKIADQVFDYLTTERYQLPSGELLTELDKYYLDLKRPENYDKRVKFALLAMIDLNLENVKKTAVSKETNELFGELKKQSKKNKTVTVNPKSPSKELPRFQFNHAK